MRDALEPLLADGLTVALLHHFAKLTETQNQRQPGERMSGTGAMFEALDVGLYITKSESGARRLRVELRAATSPAPTRSASSSSAPAAASTAASPTSTPRAWSSTLGGRRSRPPSRARGAPRRRRVAHSDRAREQDEGYRREPRRRDRRPHRIPGAVRTSRGGRVGRHVNAKPWGTIAMLRELERLARPAEQDEQDEQDEALNPSSERVAPTGRQHEQHVQSTRRCCSARRARQDTRRAGARAPRSTCRRMGLG